MKLNFSTFTKIIWYLTFLFPLFSIASSRTAPIEINLKDAINRNIVVARITGTFDNTLYSEILNGDGMYFGKCMAIYLRNNSDSLLRLKLDKGLFLVPGDSSVQTMLITSTSIFQLSPNSEYMNRIYAMCSEIHDASPDFSIEFTIGGQADSNLVKLATYIEENYIQNKIGQHAVWAYTNNATEKELIQYGANSTSLSLTKNILTSLSIATALTSNSISKKPQQKDLNNTIRVNVYLLYTGIVLLFSLGVCLIIVIFKNKINV